MSSVFRFFVDNWRFSLIVTAFIFLAGVLSLVLLKREAFPPVNFARVKVSTFYPGASPEEVEDKVTRVIEDELRGIDNIDDVRSLSQSELSEIDIRVDIDIPNPQDTINEIQRAVQRASARLPSDLPDDPRVVEVKAREIPILEMAVVGPNSQRLRDLWADQLQKRLEDVSGVASVRKVGYREREYQIFLNPELMRERHIGVSEVNQAVVNKMKNVPAGYLRGKSDIRLVRVVGQIKDLQELEDIIVRSNDAGEIVRIRDIARVQEGSEEASVLTRFDGEEATLVLTNKKADVDALKTLQKVRAELESFEKIMPKELRLEIYNDEGRRIQNRLEIVNFNGLAGLVIVVLVLFLFLPGKVGLTSALSLPLCILGTVILMILNGATFNIITMLALIICLGNLVDNSVVISEYYTTLREKGVSPPEAAVQAAQQFWVPFTASTITIIAAFVPMLLTTGVFGQFIRWIPIVVAAALVMSLVESLTLLPARLQFLTARSRGSSRQAYFFSKFEKVFMDLVQASLRRRWTTMAFLTALIISGFVVTAVFNRFELFPAEGVEFYVIRFEGPVDQNLQSTDAIAEQLSQRVREKLDPSWVKAVVARSGLQSFGPGDPQAKTGENVGMVQVGIQPKLAQDLNINEVLKALKSIDRPPQLTAFNVEALKGGPPVGKPLTLTLRSSDEEQVRKMADELLKQLSVIPGTIDIRDDEIRGGPEYVVRLKDRNAAAAGLRESNVGLDLRTALEGFEAAELVKGGNEFKVRVQFDELRRRNLGSLEDAQILNPRGNLIPLRQIAEIQQVKGPSVRKSFDFKRSITITGEVDPRIITATALNSRAREIVSDLRLKYPQVSPVYGGEDEATKESLTSLGLALLAAVFLIFATLVFTFRSFTKPFLILSSIPLGLIGVCYAFVFDQRPLSFLAFVGVVGLSGVVINSAIILVDYIDELRREMKDEALSKILVLASGQRLRAVLATGLTTVVGLLPSAFGWGGYDPILVPMCLALSWGMIVGTLLALIWIPVGYLVLDELKEWLLKKWVPKRA